MTQATLETIRSLAQTREAPAITLVCPLDERLPGNQHDSRVLAQLRDDAISRLQAFEGTTASDMQARLDDVLATVDLMHPTRAIAVFVSPTLSQVLNFDGRVEARVAVSDRFHIGEVVRAFSRQQRARVLVLSLQETRCVDITNDAAREQLGFGFPVRESAPTEEDTPHADFPLDEHEHAEAAKFVFRAVDRALHDLELHDDRPLVLVGVERDLAYFREVSHDEHREVVGEIHGNHERDSVSRIAAIAQTALEAHDREARQEASNDMREAIATKAVAGIQQAWAAARDGRGRRLVVEDGFAYRARADDGLLAPAADGDDTFDAVEATIEEVVRHDGDVIVVEPDSLADLDHIALLTRY